MTSQATSLQGNEVRQHKLTFRKGQAGLPRPFTLPTYPPSFSLIEALGHDATLKFVGFSIGLHRHACQVLLPPQLVAERLQGDLVLLSPHSLRPRDRTC